MKRQERRSVGANRRSDRHSVSLKAILYAAVAIALIIVVVAHYTFAQQSSVAQAGVAASKSKSKSSLANSDVVIDHSSKSDDLLGRTIRSKAEVDESNGIQREKYHIVFSTDCSAYQHWQSYVLFYSALKIGQPGYVTRIASGCSEKEEKAEVEWHNKHIRGPMSDKFGIHLTPHFSSVKKDGEIVGDYEFFNKPFGMRHWMENGEGMGIDPSTGNMKNEDTIIVLLDPDHILLRPFSDDFSNDDEIIVTGTHMENRRFKVEHGSPFGQLYGLGAKWKEFDLDVIAGKESPANEVSTSEAIRDYPAGPPYLATARDMYQISMKWAETVPKVHAEYPFLLAEMYAYCIAAADKKLPHQIVDSLMVSNTGMSRGEGWKFVDKVPAEEVCEYASNLDHKKHALPNVLHHCQRYMLGKHFFGKRRLPKDFFTCESPMLIEVPGDIALKYDYRIPPPPHKPPGEKKPVSKKIVKRETFMLCAVTTALNEASEFFKRHACEGVKGTDYSKSMDLWNVPLS
uniref:Uncharacterized protein n=1 Tax=Odontella aurita TaxID=265563 RepID=A0A7S4ITR3_9STRA|mmetsp:Transcript_30230/g.89998  ORF Transcript_30230/g.89998 Transcript_30230/m.89998 type:complete len:514 (+) Transcript_30230:90-1631(+)